ncbi:hypothetical protein BDQ17DRAFT_771336, partial [Cyathus striatus]
ISTFGALGSLLAVGFGLNSGFAVLSSIATLTFVTSFAIGLGPIPFVMIPEVSPPHVRLRIRASAGFTDTTYKLGYCDVFGGPLPQL